MTKENNSPKFIFVCQKDDREFHLLSAANGHTDESGHRDFWLHVNGESKKK
jgi:hypothetical protein